MLMEPDVHNAVLDLQKYFAVSRCAYDSAARSDVPFSFVSVFRLLFSFLYFHL